MHDLFSEANTTVEIGRHTHFDCTAHRSTGKIQNWTNIGFGFLPFLQCFSLFDAVLVCCVSRFHVLLLHENWVDPTGGDQRWPKRENMGMGQKLLYVYIYIYIYIIIYHIYIHIIVIIVYNNDNIILYYIILYYIIQYYIILYYIILYYTILYILHYILHYVLHYITI